MQKFTVIAEPSAEGTANKKRCKECTFNTSCRFIDSCDGCEFKQTCKNQCIMFNRNKEVTIEDKLKAAM